MNMQLNSNYMFYSKINHVKSFQYLIKLHTRYICLFIVFINILHIIYIYIYIYIHIYIYINKNTVIKSYS